jgi:hypothetical protein
MCFDFVVWASELFGSEPVRNRRLWNKCPKKIWVGSLGLLWLFARERRGGRVNPNKVINLK